MTTTHTLTIHNFTDPMMGLSYESEPFLRRLETHFAGRVDIKYVMSGLVRDVRDFLDPADLQQGLDIAISRYNERLARIYEAEEPISGMPINMSNLRLFSPEHTSSVPLNLAYKAAQLAAPDKADLLLYNLRFTTIVECRPTTQFAEITQVVQQTGIPTDAFIRHFNGGTAKAALDDDFRLRQRIGVTRLPAYLFQYVGTQMLVSGVLDWDGFVDAISAVTHGRLTPRKPQPSTRAVAELIERHPLISPIEIREAFDLSSVDDVSALIAPLLTAGRIRIEPAHRGWFIRKHTSET